MADNEKDMGPDYVDDLKAEGTHVGNEKAFKGDDSDGEVQWTFRTVIAAITLGCLYTGMLRAKIISTPD
jgi:hypothetical protein